jgi:hypothetical protein
VVKTDADLIKSLLVGFIVSLLLNEFQLTKIGEQI